MLKITVENYSLTRRGESLLKDLSFSVAGPGAIGLVGPSRSGKSLLLHAIAGRLPRGIEATGRLERTLAGGPAPGRLSPPLAAEGIPPGRGTLFARLAAEAPGDAERRVEAALKRTGLWDEFQERLLHPVRALTPGERLLLSPVRALVASEPILLLDEPTFALDPGEEAAFQRAVRAVAQEIPVIWATRALRRVAPAADRIIVLADGAIRADGPIGPMVVRPPAQGEAAIQEAAGRTVGADEHGLEDLYHELLSMGAKVERAIHLAVQSLTDQNLSIARDVVVGDAAIDHLEETIQEKALGMIGRLAPVGLELRTLTTVIRAATDLERIADHAVNISEITLAIGEEPLIKPLIDIPRMAEKAQTMVRRGLDAMVRRDVALAEEVCQSDVPVDDLYRELFEELLGFVTDGGDAYRAGQALHLLFVARFLERVADRATNIAEHVIFMVTGEQVKRRKGSDQSGLSRFPHRPLG